MAKAKEKSEPLPEEGAFRNAFGLTNKQEAFAQALIVEDTLSDAYRSAYDCSGMTAKTVNERASVDSKHAKIAARVAELRDRVSKSTDVTLERWMREQARIAYSDPLQIYNDDGTLKLLSEMSPDARAAIASIDTEIRFEGRGEDVEEITVKKVKMHSKVIAQDSIGRALGAYEKDNKQRGDIIPVIVNAPDWAKNDG